MSSDFKEVQKGILKHPEAEVSIIVKYKYSEKNKTGIISQNLISPWTVTIFTEQHPQQHLYIF
jgi:hypothetical protein